MLMDIVIVANNLPPAKCGIADYSQCLADELLRLDNHVIIAGKGCGEVTDTVIPVGGAWDKKAFDFLLSELKKRKISHVLLQYTPLSFRSGKGLWDNLLLGFWQNVAAQWQPSLVIHDFPSRSFRYPLSLARSVIQKKQLKLLTRISEHVFTASEPLLKELSGWGLKHKAVCLPIGSGIPFIPAGRLQARQKNKVGGDEIVLALFGKRTNIALQRPYIKALDRHLLKNKIKARWLFFKSVDCIPAREFSFSLPVIEVEHASKAELSSLMQMSDIFILPDCLKATRASVMVAIQHALPVVSLEGKDTDSFWHNIGGVILAHAGDKQAFCKKVEILCADAALRRSCGEKNRGYFNNNFTWEHIASVLLNELSVY